MSYILDAIKKSEAERGHGSIPGLQTVHSSSLNYKTEAKQFWPYIIISLLLLNLGGFIFYYFKEQNLTPSPVNSAEQTRPMPADTQLSAANKPLSVLEKKTEPVISVTDTPTQVTTGSEQTVPQYNAITAEDTETIPIRNNQVVDETYTIEDLPEDIKQRIPMMDFTGHVFSSNPKQRSIIINGSFMEEGNAINHELTLTEITSKGALFSIQGVHFEIGVLTGWKLN